MGFNSRTWIPELKLVEVPFLAELRREHLELLDVWGGVNEARRALEKRFGAEDRDLRTSIAAALRAGEEPESEWPATSPARRDAERLVAEERVAEAVVQLRRFGGRTRQTVLARWPEVETAIAETSARFRAHPAAPVAVRAGADLPKEERALRWFHQELVRGGAEASAA